MLFWRRNLAGMCRFVGDNWTRKKPRKTNKLFIQQRHFKAIYKNNKLEPRRVNTYLTPFS